MALADRGTWPEDPDRPGLRVVEDPATRVEVLIGGRGSRLGGLGLTRPAACELADGGHVVAVDEATVLHESSGPVPVRSAVIAFACCSVCGRGLVSIGRGGTEWDDCTWYEVYEPHKVGGGRYVSETTANRNRREFEDQHPERYRGKASCLYVELGD